MRNLRFAPILAVGVMALALTACSRERQDWTSAQQADTAEGYQQFLQQHPNSGNAPQAQTRIKQLADDRDWQAASAADTRDAYEQFVAQHADSKWAQEARIRIENFAQSVAGAQAPLPVAPPSVAASSAKPAAATAPAKSAATTASARPAASPAPAESKGKTSAAAHGGSRYVQLGAFSSKARAEGEWKALVAKFPSELRSLKPRYVAGKGKSKQVYRLQVGTASSADGRALCITLKKHSQACVVVG